MHREFLEDYTDDGPLAIGRGRVIPSSPWESIWKPLVEWFGVTDSADIEEILPNAANFAEEAFHDELLY